MLQALSTLLFATLAFGTTGVIALLLRNDWDVISAALGFSRRVDYHAPQPPQVRVRSARRAVMVRLEAPQRRAAA